MCDVMLCYARNENDMNMTGFKVEDKSLKYGVINRYMAMKMTMEKRGKKIE